MTIIAIAGPDRVEVVAVGDVQLHARAGDAGVLGDRGREVRLAELDARQSELVERLGPPVVDPRRADQLERPGGAAALGQVGALEQAGARVDHRGLDRAACWATASPTAGRSPRRTWSRRQPFIRRHGQLDRRRGVGVLGQELGVEQPGQLAHRHAVLLGDRLAADEGGVLGMHHRPVRRGRADRVGPVEHDEPHAGQRGAATMQSYIVQM